MTKRDTKRRVFRFAGMLNSVALTIRFAHPLELFFTLIMLGMAFRNCKFKLEEDEELEHHLSSRFNLALILAWDCVVILLPHGCCDEPSSVNDLYRNRLGKYALNTIGLQK